MRKLLFLLILTAATLGCAKPKPQSTPAPPPATAPAPQADKKAPRLVIGEMAAELRSIIRDAKRRMAKDMESGGNA